VLAVIAFNFSVMHLRVTHVYSNRISLFSVLEPKHNRMLEDDAMEMEMEMRMRMMGDPVVIALIRSVNRCDIPLLSV